jgi:hypothetical protein
VQANDDTVAALQPDRPALRQPEARREVRRAGRAAGPVGLAVPSVQGDAGSARRPGERSQPDRDATPSSVQVRMRAVSHRDGRIVKHANGDSVAARNLTGA